MPIVRVRGRSMSPTLKPGDVVWAVPAPVVQRGDIVLVRKPGYLIKRVVGLPGEHVELKSGRLFVNNSALLEPYVPDQAHLEPQPDKSFDLAPFAYLALGDAR